MLKILVKSLGLGSVMSLTRLGIYIARLTRLGIYIARAELFSCCVCHSHTGTIPILLNIYLPSNIYSGKRKTYFVLTQ